MTSVTNLWGNLIDVMEDFYILKLKSPIDDAKAANGMSDDPYEMPGLLKEGKFASELSTRPYEPVSLMFSIFISML